MDGSLWTKVCGRKVVDESLWTEVRGRKSDGRQRTSDESPTYVERVELSRRCGNGGRWRYTAALRNVATMAENAVVCNVVAALAGNALDLAALLRWPATRRCYDNALDLATLLRWSATRWTSQRCCDGRQRARPHSGAAMSSSALQLQRFCFFFLFFFTPDNLKREKEWEKERSFDTCSLVSRLHLSQLGWL